MRLMLGNGKNPSLLVSVKNDYDPNDFDFEVINGGWRGHFHNGYTTVCRAPGGAFSSLNKREIICDNQDRLRGEYQTVFEYFSDENYVAPLPKPIPMDEFFDDDIPF